VVFNGEKRRTKAIHRGGQHPEWDEEMRFTLFEDDEGDIPQIEGLDAPPPPPKKDSKTGKRKIKGGKHLVVSVYADDPREPDLIGETKIDLTEVLTKGETDGEQRSLFIFLGKLTKTRRMVHLEPQGSVQRRNLL
jgi:neural Wiskott-Aldrich syndrome protein